MIQEVTTDHRSLDDIITPAPNHDNIEAGSVELGSETYTNEKDLNPGYNNKFAQDAFDIHQAENGEDYVDFRSMSWLQAGFVSTAENIALGLLSFPSIFERLGMAGGMIATVFLGVLAYFTAWIMVDLKLRNPGVMNIVDAGELMFGKWGKRVIGTGLVLKVMGMAGSHTVAGEDALRSLSNNAICGVWWGVIVVVVSVMMSYSREWGKLSWWSFVSLTCIISASIVTMVAVGVQGDQRLIVNNVPIEWYAWPRNANLVDIIGALTNIVFAYGGNVAVFSFCSEMRRPNDFKKSMLINQGAGTIAYVIVGGVIYSSGGQYTTSPAFTMTYRTVNIIAYSLALVTIMISGILAVNIGAKYLYVATLRNSPLLTAKGWKSQLIWTGLVSLIWIVGFIVSQLIPFFNQLLTIISSLFSVWMSYGFPGLIWMWDKAPFTRGLARDPEERKMNKLKWFLGICGVISIILSLAITPLGLYSAAMGIQQGYSQGIYKHPFSC